MDQDAVVSEPTGCGKRLIEALMAGGFDVRVAFETRLTDEGKWFLYRVSPIVDQEGPAVAYRLVQENLRRMPDLLLDIRVVGLCESLARSVLELIKTKVPNRPFAVPNPRPYPGMTRLGESTLGGVDIDGAYIYPPIQPGAPT